MIKIMEKVEQKLPEETKKNLIKSVSATLLETAKLLQTSGGKGATIIGAILGIAGCALGYLFGII